MKTKLYMIIIKNETPGEIHEIKLLLNLTPTEINFLKIFAALVNQSINSISCTCNHRILIRGD